AATFVDAAKEGAAPDIFNSIPKARLALARGDASRAVEEAARGVERLNETGYRMIEVAGMTVLARALAAAKNTDDAAAVLNDAHRIAVENTMVRHDREIARVAAELGVALAEEPAADEQRTAPDAALPVGERLVSVLF